MPNEIGQIVKGERLSPRTEFKRGHEPWMKGKSHSLESREKLRISHTGKKLSEQHKLKI